MQISSFIIACFEGWRVQNSHSGNWVYILHCHDVAECVSWYPFYLCANVGPQGLLVVRLPAQFIPHSASLSPAMAMRVLSSPAAHLRPSYRSGWMFIFYFLGVGLPCCSIFCQFWLCEEAQCVYLRRHLGSPPKSITHVYAFWPCFVSAGHTGFGFIEGIRNTGFR